MTGYLSEKRSGEVDMPLVFGKSGLGGDDDRYGGDMAA